MLRLVAFRAGERHVDALVLDALLVERDADLRREQAEWSGI
jgi:hypothetical protein